MQGVVRVLQAVLDWEMAAVAPPEVDPRVDVLPPPASRIWPCNWGPGTTRHVPSGGCGQELRKRGRA